MPAESSQQRYESERRVSNGRRRRVSRRAWTLSAVFALGCLTSIGTIRMFRSSVLEVHQADSPATPVEVPAKVLTSGPSTRTQPTAASKPASPTAQPLGVARGAKRPELPRPATERKPAPSPMAPPLETGNGVAVHPVETGGIVRGDSALPPLVTRSDDETRVPEPPTERVSSEREALPPETRPAEPVAAVASTVAIESVLKNYAHAFTARDVGAAKSVWPRVNERALGRAFESVQEQHFDLGSCEISVEGSTAVAMCVGTASYRPKLGIGKMRAERRRWTFQLEHKDAVWTIDDVEVR